MSHTQQDSLLSRKEKTAFFSMNIANIPVMTLISSLLLFYYTDVVGMDPIVIGTLFLVSRILDGINDPLMGYVIDHLPRTKLGRFRTYLLIGSIVCSLNYLLLWLGPSLASSGKVVIAFITYILLGFTFDLMDIPLNSMIPTMSDKDKDRTTLSNIKGIAYMTGAVIFTIGSIPFIESFSSKTQGFHILIIFASLFVLTFTILGVMGVKERIQPITGEKYSVRQIFQILGAKPVLILFLDTLLYQIGKGISDAIMIFFFGYVLNRLDLYPLIGVSYAVGLTIGAILGPKLIKRYGKKNTKIIGSVIAVILPITLFFVPPTAPLVFVVMVLITSPGTGINAILTYSIQADNMDYIEWKNGYRADGAVASINSFIIKASSGVGAAIAAFMLGVIKYVPNAVQTPETIQGFYYLNYAIPALASVCSLLIWAFGYPLTTKIRKEMMAELVERRNTMKTQ